MCHIHIWLFPKWFLFFFCLWGYTTNSLGPKNHIQKSRAMTRALKRANMNGLSQQPILVVRLSPKIFLRHWYCWIVDFQISYFASKQNKKEGRGWGNNFWRGNPAMHVFFMYLEMVAAFLVIKWKRVFSVAGNGSRNEHCGLFLLCLHSSPNERKKQENFSGV